MSNLIRFSQHLKSVHRVDGGSAVLEASDSEEGAMPEASTRAALDQAFENGRASALAEQGEALQAVRALQDETLRALRDFEVRLAEEAEAALPELIVEGVRRIIDGWQPEAEQVETLVRDMLAGLEGDAGPLRVSLSPEDKRRMLSLHENLERDYPGVSILEDSELRSGECLARGRFGVVDGRFEARLASLRKVFG